MERQYGSHEEALQVAKEDVPWNLAKEYYRRCDRYDADVCTGKREGVPMPASDEEFRLINRHALKVLRELQDRCRAFGFSVSDLRAAMQEYIKTEERSRGDGQ